MFQPFNMIFLGRLAVALNQLIFIILCNSLLSVDDANQIFIYIALASIVTTISAFGANGALVQLLRDNVEEKYSLTIYLVVMRLIICLISSYALSLVFYDAGSFLHIGFLAFCNSFLFVDFIAESEGDDEIDRLSLIKLNIFVCGILLKILCINYIDYLKYMIFMEWPLIFLLYMKRKLGDLVFVNIQSKKLMNKFFGFLMSTSWIWVSGVMNLSWTRSFFILLSKHVDTATGNIFFTSLKIFEGLLILPNSVAMRYFHKLLSAKEMNDSRVYIEIKKQFFKASYFVAIAVSALSLIGYLVFSVYQGETASNTYSLFLVVLFVGFIMSVRVTLSREIILTKKFNLSFISYSSGIVASLFYYHYILVDTLIDSFVFLSIFYTFSFITPFMCSSRLRKSYFKYAM